MRVCSVLVSTGSTAATRPLARRPRVVSSASSPASSTRQALSASTAHCRACAFACGSALPSATWNSKLTESPAATPDRPTSNSPAAGCAGSSPTPPCGAQGRACVSQACSRDRPKASIWKNCTSVSVKAACDASLMRLTSDCAA